MNDTKNLIEISGHLSDETILLLKQGRLGSADCIAALDHLGRCPLCALAFAGAFDGDALLEPGPDFAERALTAAERAGGRSAPPAARRAREFYSYALRVAAAACMALAILLSGPLDRAVDAIENEQVVFTRTIDLSGVDAFNESVHDMTDKIIRLEVNENDQKEK